MAPILKDKIAIVTGAGRGLGKAFAMKYADEGAKLLLPDISPERAQETAEAIRVKGGQAVAMEADFSDEKSTRMMAEKVMRLYGRVDILFARQPEVPAGARYPKTRRDAYFGESCCLNRRHPEETAHHLLVRKGLFKSIILIGSEISFVFA
jgi:NAD(P)-dependent dehydrogenase (short-subunit alcohol dehydrogenase family)